MNNTDHTSSSTDHHRMTSCVVSQLWMNQMDVDTRFSSTGQTLVNVSDQTERSLCVLSAQSPEQCWSHTLLQTNDVKTSHFFMFSFQFQWCDGAVILILVGPVRFRWGKHVQVWNTWFCLHKHGWRMSWGLIKYVQCFHTYRWHLEQPGLWLVNPLAKL